VPKTPATPDSKTRRPKRFRLSFVGPIEDQPRLIRAYGRACDGEFALVMRPSEARAVLVLITKKDGAFMWRSGAEPEDDGLVHAKALVLRERRTRLRIETGEHAGASFLPYEEVPSHVEHGELVDVAFNPDDQFAHVQAAGAGGDAPLRPETPIEPADAVKLVKVEQKAVPKAGPITLRGRWTGYLYCDDGKPRVELRRKLATYGTLTITSHMERGWSWSFERAAKWFSEEGATGGEGLPTLSTAIEAGALGAMRLVREACAFRDTRRRAAHDPEYAAKHPIKPPKPMKNPTERLRVRDRGRKRRAAPPPKPLDDGTPKPQVPADAAALDRMAEVASREGDALARLKGTRWIWEETTPVRDIADWFDDSGFEGIGERVRGYAGHPDHPLDDFMAELDGELKAAERLHDPDPDAAVYKEARRQLGLLRETLTSTPAMMERARRLVRYAASMVQSPMCKGPEQREALDAVGRATQAYETAREAILEGRPWDALRTLRRIGDRVALSAAKAARSCAAGQTSLTARAREADPLAEQVAAFAAKPSAATAKRWMKAALAAVGLAPLSLSARSRGGAVHVKVVLPEDGESGETNEAMRGIADAVPRGLVLDGWDFRAPGAKRSRKAPAAPAPSPAAPDDWRPFDEGDRVVLDGVHGMVSRIPARVYGPDDKVTFLADGNRTGRRIAAKRLQREHEVGVEAPAGAEAAPPADAEKDKALIDAFSAAIAAALGQEAA